MKTSPLFGAMLLLILSVLPVYAHEEIEHATEAEARVHEIETSLRRSSSTTQYSGTPQRSSTLQALVEKYRAKFGKSTKKQTASTDFSLRGNSIANVDASCVQTAVDTREVAVQNAFGTSDTAVMDALKARQTALYAAWGQTEVNARNIALKNAWKAWKDAQKAAGKTLKSERDTAWKTFKTTVKDTCKVSVPTEDASAGSDTAGQTAI
jgi:hypothetical protein